MKNELSLDQELQALKDVVLTQTQSTESYLSSTREGLEIARLQEELEGRKQDRKQRGGYANKIFILLCSYLGLGLIILILIGFGAMTLSDSVIIALLTTSTANVIGIFVFVAKYLFHTTE